MAREEDAALAALAAWADELAAPSYQAGTWHPSERNSDGAWSLAWWRPSPRTRAFLADLTRHGWVTPRVDWMRWAPTDEARRLLHDRAAVAAASVDDLRHLVTATVRGDRFAEGTLAEAFDSGLFAAIAARARVLLEDR